MENPLFTDPFDWFDAWFAEATHSGMADPNAMTLATASKAGHPSARVVLLKSHDTRGFVFYSNMESRKGVQVAENPHVSLSFFWQQLGRQVRIEGTCERVGNDEADAYFASRPRVSKLGAWASQQSRPLENRQALMLAVQKFAEKWPEGTSIPRPPHWTGVRVAPNRFEFWQAGEFRLHDSFLFEPVGGSWKVDRLNP